MKTINKLKILALASKNFTNENYEQALQNYALVLKDHPNSQEAYNGAILAEMAMSGENGAVALFDYYDVLREENKEEADIIISEILNTMDGTLDQLGELLQIPLKERLMYEDGILYSEFKELIAKDGDFKRIFENIMFSTRVIITEKDDFVDFLENLIDYNYHDMALSYLESALSVYANDTHMRSLLRRLSKGRVIEN